MRRNAIIIILLIIPGLAIKAQIISPSVKDIPAGMKIKTIKETKHSFQAPYGPNDYQWHALPSPTTDEVTEASIAGDGAVLVVFYRKPRPSLNTDEGIIEKWTGSSWSNVAQATNECHYPDIDVKGSVVIATWNTDGNDYGYGTNVNGPWVSMTGTLLYKQWFPRATMAMGLPYMSFTCMYSDGMPSTYDMLHIRSLIGPGDRIELKGGWSVPYTSVASKTDITGDQNAWYTVFSQQQYLYVMKGAIQDGVKSYSDLGEGFRMYNPVSNPEIVLFNGNPFVAWLENGNTELYVAEWDGAQWLVVGAAAAESGIFQSVRMASSSSELFVVIKSTDPGSGLSVNSYDGDQWFSFPDAQNQSGSSIGTADISVHNNNPVVAFTENNKLVVKTFSANAPTGTGNFPDPASQLSCFPNPTEGLIEVETPESGLFLIEITSLTGKLIHSQKLSGKNTLIDLSNQREGVYFITVKNENYIETRKVIKR